MAADSGSVFNAVFKRLSHNGSCVSAIRSLMKRGIDVKPLVEPICLIVFFDHQPKWGMERLLSQRGTGHDWRSLKRLPKRLKKFRDESGHLERSVGRQLDCFRV